MAYGIESSAVTLAGEDESVSSVFKPARKLAYLPSLSTTYTLWYRWRYMTVTRVQQQTQGYGLLVCVVNFGD